MKKLGLRKKSRIFNGRTGKGLPLLGTLRTMSESKEALRERKSREKRIRGRKYKELLIEHLGENVSLVDTIDVQQVLIFITQFQKKKNLL